MTRQLYGRVADELLSGFLPEVRAELHRQLDELGIELRLGTSLTALPPVEDGVAGTFTVTTSAGDQITADIWFRCFGVRLNTGFFADGRLVTPTAGGMVPVDEHLNIPGHELALQLRPEVLGHDQRSVHRSLLRAVQPKLTRAWAV